MTYKYMKAILAICCFLGLRIWLLPASICASASLAETYQSDYIEKINYSDQGVYGSSANCIYAAKNGVLWIGSYTGLLSYDSYEFTSYQIEDHAIAVNAVTQDNAGNIWVGTNGNGLYYYDGKEFHVCPIDSDKNMAYTINELYSDMDGNLWAATNLGLFFVDLSSEEKLAVPVSEGIQEEIRDIAILSDGRKAFVTRLGALYFVELDGSVHEMEVPELDSGDKIRCIANTSSTDLYLGTSGSEILHLNAEGTFIRIIEAKGLASFNQIYEFDDDKYWVCSDSGIGIMTGDEITTLNYALDNSVESICEDYQGNYWFASSRQGILHIYENYFTDLNSCMNIDQMVNSIQPFHDRIYIGSDKGLSCYKNSERVLDDSLVNASKGLRIRQIYVDRDDAIWILSYQKGLICQSPDEKIYYINSKNSELKNDSLRCIYEREDGSFVLGTEAGIFSLQKDGTVSRLVDDSTLNSERILSVAEDEKGILYIGTDSDGLYVVEEDKIIGQITMKDGMFSNVILKIRTSENLNGIWVVTGSGICFIDENHKVSRVESVNIANSLDLIYLNQEEVAILAGNGFFRMKEEDLLSDDINYVHYDKKLGLPIDFTANANNIVKDGILYMCGINGAASLNLSKEEIHRDIWIYVKDIQSDGKNIYLGDDITSIDPKTHRLNLDFRILNYTNEDVDVRFMLEGTDKSFSSISGSESTIVSYTNLKGGDYNYYFEVLDRNSGQILAKEKLKLFKRYTFGEMPYVHLILTILGLLILALAVSMILFFRDKSLKEKYRKKYHQKHKEDLNKIAYQDIVTGVSNRNCYEKDIAEVDMKKLFAISTVSINHGEYLKRKYGMLYFEDILKNTTQILKNHAGKDVRIYRLSEYIFCIWFKKPVELEQYIIRIKEEFQELYEKEKEEEVSGLAVGAIYYEPLLHEDYESLFKRCEEMRILNQKHEEMKFMDRKIQYMNTAGIS